MSEADRKLLALTAEECEAFRSEIEDTPNWLWNLGVTLRRPVDDFLDGPPPGWTPSKLEDDG